MTSFHEYILTPWVHMCDVIAAGVQYSRWSKVQRPFFYSIFVAVTCISNVRFGLLERMPEEEPVCVPDAGWHWCQVKVNDVEERFSTFSILRVLNHFCQKKEQDTQVLTQV